MRQLVLMYSYIKHLMVDAGQISGVRTQRGYVQWIGVAKKGRGCHANIVRTALTLIFLSQLSDKFALNYRGRSRLLSSRFKGLLVASQAAIGDIPSPFRLIVYGYDAEISVSG